MIWGYQEGGYPRRYMLHSFRLSRKLNLISSAQDLAIKHARFVIHQICPCHFLSATGRIEHRYPIRREETIKLSSALAMAIIFSVPKIRHFCDMGKFCWDFVDFLLVLVNILLKTHL